MAYDEGLAHRVEEILAEQPETTTKKMFGGIAYMCNGNMACGVHESNLIVRVGPERYEEYLQQPAIQPFGPAGRPMKGWVLVSAEGTEADVDLQTWIQRGLDFAASLPAK